MPQELPGFYYDPEKNRYFPIKGPIPGSSRKPPATPKPTQVPNPHRRDNRISKLLHYRELYGNLINSSNQKGSFEKQCKEKLVSQPKVWKYQGLDRDGDGALSIVRIEVETPVGQCTSDALLTGSVNCRLSLFDIGNFGRYVNHGIKNSLNCVWPESSEVDCSEMLKDIWRLNGATIILPSSISCISVPRKEYIHADDDGSVMQHALVTTLGSEVCGGSLAVLNLADPVDLTSNIPAVERLRELALLNCTIWAADSLCNGNRAVLGTDLGATLVDLETGVRSNLCRRKRCSLWTEKWSSSNS